MARDTVEEKERLVGLVSERENLSLTDEAGRPLTNRKVVANYLDWMAGQGRKVGTLVSTANALRRLDGDLGRPLDQLTQRDLEGWFSGLRVRDSRTGTSLGPVSENTRTLYRVITKAFYRRRLRYRFNELAMADWLEGGTTASDLTADDMITPGEARRIIDSAGSERDRAMLHALYETGMRLSELLALTVGSVKPRDDGSADLVLPDGARHLKTGRRIIPIIESLPALMRWLEHHPHRGRPTAALWPANRGDRTKAMDPDTVRGIIQDAAARAEVTKPINPHNFRRSAATLRAQRNWNERAMAKYFGWAPGSKQPSHYVHLSDEDVRTQVLRDAGRKPKPKPEENPLAPQACWFCGEANAPTATFCDRCGRPLSVERVTEARRRDDLLLRLARRVFAGSLRAEKLKEAAEFATAIEEIQAKKDVGRKAPKDPPLDPATERALTKAERQYVARAEAEEEAEGGDEKG